MTGIPTAQPKLDIDTPYTAPENPFAQSSAPPPPLKMRPISDVKQLRSAVYQSVLDAAGKIRPLENAKYSLALRDAHYADPEDKFDREAEKQAKLRKQTLGRRLVGTWELRDKTTGQVVEQKKNTLAVVPHVTDNGLFIHRGTGYAMINQQRLLPGIFNRVKKNGEMESYANVAQGHGATHRYILNPDTGVFYVNVKNSRVPLMPLLKTLGATREEIEAAWGPELTAVNENKKDPKALQKLYDNLVPARLKKQTNFATDQSAAIREAFQDMIVDREVMKRTVRKDVDRIDHSTILAATSKVLEMARGEEEGDDRDHPAFQQFVTPEDVFAEKLLKDYNKEQRQLFYKAARVGSLKNLAPKALERQLHAGILSSGLAIAVEEANPTDVRDKLSRITRMGEGGLQSLDSIPDEARNVHVSQAGFIDPVRTTECFSADTEVMTDLGWVAWPQVNGDTRFACLIDNRLEFHTAETLTRDRFSGQLHQLRTGTFSYLVTPNHRMWVCCEHRGSLMRFEYAANMHGKQRKFICAGHSPYVGDASKVKFVWPVSVKGSNSQLSLPDVTIEDYCEFMGWYLGEGSLTDTARKGQNYREYKCYISQCEVANPAKFRQIEALLTRMGLNFSFMRRYTSDNKPKSGFVICSKQLFEYLSQFGEQPDRFIPDDVMSAGPEARRRCLDALLAGEGSAYNRNNPDRRVFHTCSHKLQTGVIRLAFSLGMSVGDSWRDDDREERYLRMYKVMLHTRDMRVALSYRNKDTAYSMVDYDGFVYCATVPGGLLYTRREGRSGFWSGNSLRVGVDVNLARNVMKGSDGKIYTKMVDREGNEVYKNPQELFDSTVGLDRKPLIGKYHVVSKNSKITFAPADKIDFFLPNFESSFSDLGNIVPYKSAMAAQRMAMGSRMSQQALPLEGAEAPLVQSGVPEEEDVSFEDRMGESLGTVRAEMDGIVEKVDKTGMVVRNSDGSRKTYSLYNFMPNARKTYTTNIPMVKPGQRITSGQLLAKSNFTDDNGTAAIGLNMRTGYISMDNNWEDAVVISESAAKKLNSQHAYKFATERTKDYKVAPFEYASIFPGKYNKKQLETIDDNGLVKVGTIVQPGDPIVLQAKVRATERSMLNRGAKRSFADETMVWDHHDAGEVTDVVSEGNKHLVVVKSNQTAKIGDKLANRFGNKGVISDILPDNKMPHDEQGRPIELAFSPLGIISRGNPVQIPEVVLGKIAALRGKPYKLRDGMDHEDLVDFAMQEAKKYGVKDVETFTDPDTGRQIPNVLAGPSYILKLHHTSESKSQGRGTGRYTSEGAPAKGGEEGGKAKRFASLELNAIVAHGAYEFAKNARLIRGQNNPDYWRAFRSGFNPPDPGTPFIYDKFMDMLRGSGIQPAQEGSKIQLFAMRDSDVQRLAKDREVKNGKMVNFAKDDAPEAGGLFDPKIFGDGTMFGKITLTEPMPNPVMEEPIRKILGLTEKVYRGVLAGQQELPGFGRGPEAIAKSLKSLDLDKEMAKARAAVAGSKKTARDEAIRKFRYLKTAKDTGIHPGEWVLSQIPVLPPRLRPISRMSGPKRLPIVDDLNMLYSELIDANENLRELKPMTNDLAHERLSAYDSFKALTGLADPVSKELKQKNVTGILSKVLGKGGPKFSMLQRKLISGPVDMVGRGVIVPDSNLDMDSMAIPEEQAWDAYQSHTIRRLAKSGMNPLLAAKAVEERSPTARRAMVAEMESRPVVVSRAPVLHKYGIIALYPRITAGDTLRFNPFIFKGLAADADGDTMNFHVPTTEKEVDQIKKRMLPSNMLISTQDFSSPVFAPHNDYAAGLYVASAKVNKKQPERIFDSYESAAAAHGRGEINFDTPIRIIESRK